MARGILLDSSVVIPHLRGRLDILSHVTAADDLFISLVVLGELFKGVFKSPRPEEGKRKLTAFFVNVSTLGLDSATAIKYAQIAFELEKQGTPIPENDIWIAATALECGMPLATRDAHFAHVTGLQVLNW
jgi:tRNA(fMet)-specific endonuclease VapC